jgi:hypothetical protein
MQYNAYFRFSILENPVCTARVWLLKGIKKWNDLGNAKFQPRSADLVLYFLERRREILYGMYLNVQSHRTYFGLRSQQAGVGEDLMVDIGTGYQMMMPEERSG